ncbi:Ice-binding protein 1 [Thermoflexales bacterium]|nr:Ice-binding protein 1 [Thermoflexales bacterium]
MRTRILRLIVVVWLIASPLHVTPDTVRAMESVQGEVSHPIGWRPPLRPVLNAGAPQTVTVQVAPAALIANSGSTALITATVYDLTGELVSGVNLSGFIIPSTRGTLSGLGLTDISGTVTGTWTAGTVIGSGEIEIGDGVVSGTATINLTAGTLATVTVVPGALAITAGLTTTFTATGTDAYNNAVVITPTWETNGGSIGSTGVFTAQTFMANGRLVTATANAVAGTASVNILAGPLSSITITPTTAAVAAGTAYTFTTNGFDQYGNVITITPTWNTNGGLIDQTGVYTAQSAVAAGRWVTVSQGVISATALVTITAAPLASITVSPNPATVVAGTTQVFTASGFDQYGNTVLITPTWTTNGGSINAGTGLFTAQITATTERLVTATHATISGTASVNIIAGPLNSIVVLPNPAQVAAGTTQAFTAAGFDQYNNAVPITPTWTTNGGSINASTGLFTAQITATTSRLVTATHATISGTASVNIIAGPLSAIVLSPNPATVVAGATQAFTASGFDQYSNTVTITPTWTTNGGSINAGTGLLTAQITATAGRLVTATHGAISGIATVNIIAGPLSKIDVSPNPATVVAGTTQAFTANGFDQYNNAVVITPTWTTNGGSINAGTGLFTAQITATAGRLVTATHSAISGTASVNVIAGPLSAIVVSPNPATVVAGATQAFTASGFDQYNNAVVITPTWTTNGGSINSSGVFTAQITATTGRLITATHGAISGTANINIIAGPLNSIVVSPNPANVVAGTTQAFTANGFDQYNNAVVITPTWTTNGGSINSSTGLFTAQITATPGRLVTATHSAISGTASVNVIAGPLNRIDVAPSSVTMTVATTQTFTASGFDQYNNTVVITPTWTTNGGSVNSSGLFTAQTIMATGKRVTATHGITTGVALVNLLPGAPYTLTLQPPTAVISAGLRMTYTAIATDTYGNLIGNVTGGTIFSIAPASGGVFAANVVTPTLKNTWIVTGLIGSAVDTASLTVTAAAFHRLAIENAPAGSGSPVTSVTLNIYDTLTVHAAAYDVYNNLIGARSVNWGSTGVVAGNLAPTSGSSTTFTPVVSGTGTITATSNGITDTTGIITVLAPLMRISKTASPDPLTPGSALQYTIVYTNIGNAAAQNVIITETYPLSTTYVGAVPAPDVGPNVWSRGTVAAGSSGAIVVFLSTPSQMPVGSVLTNTVRVSAAKVASAVYTATTPVNSLPDLSASIIDNPDPARPGESLSYSIQYRNDGSAPVTNVRVTETYPAHVSFVSANPPPNIGNNVWLTSSLNGNGDNRTILVTVRVNSPLTDTTILNNRVVVSAQEAPPYTTTQQTLIVAPHLHLSLSAQPLTPTANDLLTYTLLYTNSGSSYAANTIITDAIPANTSFVQCEPLGCGVNGSIVTWNLGQLSQQTSNEVTLTVRVANNLLNGTVITNTARITSTDQVSALTLLTSTVASAPDVILTKSDGLTTIAAGQLTTYTLSFANVGTAPAANVLITDRIPDYTTFVGCSSCVALGSGVYSFTRGALNASQNGAVTLSVRLASTLPPGLRAITNTAAIVTTTGGDTLGNNETLDVNDISTRPVLNLKSLYDSGTPYPGKIITYTLHYTNTSAMDTIGVVITVTRPSWLANSPPGWTPDNGTDMYWIGNLAAGQSGNITYGVKLPPTFTLGMNAFLTTFFIEDGGPGELEKAQAQSLTSIGVPDLRIAQVIVPPSVVHGQKFTATLIISNAGLGRACNPKAIHCGGFYVDAFIDPAVPPLSYPFEYYGEPYAGVPPIAAGESITVVMPNLVFTPAQRSILYFKLDNFDCSPLDNTDPCLPSHSLGGLVPEYNEQNNVIGPIALTGFTVNLPLILKNAH